jgi:hypothetical protein
LKNSFIYKNISLLGKREKEQFKDFVSSPYFNKSISLSQILEQILFLQSKTGQKNLSKQQFWKLFFPKKTWNEQVLKDRLSDLMRLLEQFLGLQTFRNQDDQEQAHFALDAMNQRSMNQSFQRYWKRVQKKPQGQNTYKSSQEHHTQFLMHDISDTHYMQRGERRYTEGLQKKLDHLELFYMLEKLECCCGMLNRMNVFKSEFDIHFLEETLQLLQSNWAFYMQNQVIAIYFQILQTLQNPQEESAFQALKSLLLEYVQNLGQQQGKSVFAYARNYCTRQLNAGKTAYLQEIFDLYKLSLTHGFLLENGLISQFIYKNIVTAACRLKQFDWVEGFIFEYKEQLEKSIQANAFNYNLASFYYSQGNYGEAITLLQTIEYTDVHYNTDARVMLLKIYFEQGEIRTFFSQCDSFNIFLLRNKHLSNHQNKSYRNLVRITKKMMLLKEEKTLLTKTAFSLKKEKMGIKIEQTRPITNLQWVVEKWNGL